MRTRLLLVILLASFAVPAQTRIALFPLRNMTADPLLEWVGYGVPETFFRRLSGVEGIQVWSPVFLHLVDSSCWTLESDSVVLAHARRWKWNVAVGGLYKADDDSVWIRIRSVRIYPGQVARKEWRAKGDSESVQELCTQLVYELLVSLGHEFSSDEAAAFKNRPDKTSPHAYATYVRGYGYEMCGEYGKALSAYRYAADIDRALGLAYYRMAGLYAVSGFADEARDAYERAAGLLPESPHVIAAAAAFFVENESKQKADAFIEQHRTILHCSPAGMYAIGKSYIARGEHQRAIAILTRALAAGPSDLETDFTLGYTYLQSGEYDQAVDVFRRLIEYRPGHVRYYSMLGAAYREQGRFMESSKVLELAVQIAPDDVPNLINLATTYFSIGWNERAEQVLLRARDLSPDMGTPYLNLGVLYWKEGRSSEAREMFARAAQYPATRQAAFNNEANFLFLAGDIKNAIKAYRRADREGKKSEAILHNLGRAYMARGRQKEAAACFEEVLLLSPGRLDVLAELATLAEQMGEEEDAEQYFRKIVQLSAQNRDALKRLVQLLLKRERYEEAAEFVKGALEDFPSDRVLRLMLPEIYEKMGWYEVAIMQSEQLAAETDFQNEPRVYLGLGRCNFKLIREKNARQYDKTISYLKRAAELAPGDAEPELMLGHIYMDYKNYPSLAIENWKRALGKAVDGAMRREIRALIAGEGE